MATNGEMLEKALHDADYAISAFADGHDHCCICAKNIERALDGLRAVKVAYERFKGSPSAYRSLTEAPRRRGIKKGAAR